MFSRYAKFFLGGVVIAVLVGGVVWIRFTPQTPKESVPVTEADFKYDQVVKLLRTGDAQARAQALSSLNALIDTSTDGLSKNYVERSLLPNLLVIADKKNTEESTSALMAINKLQRSGLPRSEAAQKQAEDFLIDIVKDRSVYVDTKLPAIHGLRNTLPLSQGSIEALFVALVREPEPYVKKEIASVLVAAAKTQTNISDRLHALVLESKVDEQTQAAVVSALRFAPENAVGAGAVLSKGFESTNANVRWETMNAMMPPERFRNASEVDVAAVSSLVRSSSEPIRNRVLAVELLGRIGSTRKHPQALQTLKVAATDPNNPVEVRARAVRSIPFAFQYSDEANVFLDKFVSSEETQIADAATWGLRVVKERQELRHKAMGHN